MVLGVPRQRAERTLSPSKRGEFALRLQVPEVPVSLGRSPEAGVSSLPGRPFRSREAVAERGRGPSMALRRNFGLKASMEFSDSLNGSVEYRGIGISAADDIVDDGLN